MKLKNVLILFTLIILIPFIGIYAVYGNHHHHGPFTKDPLSLADFPQGTFLVNAQMRTAADGMDYLYFYPDSEKEFAAPLRGLTAKESALYQDVNGVFEVDFPLSKLGKRQGYLYFKKFMGAASFKEVYHHPIF